MNNTSKDIPKSNSLIYKSKAGVEFEVLAGHLVLFHEDWPEGLDLDSETIQRWDHEINPERENYWYWFDGGRACMSLEKAQLIAEAFRESGLKDIIQVMLS